MTSSFILKKIQVFYGILACLFMSMGSSALKCCYEVFSNNSAIYKLSQAPDANCTTRWDILNKVIVDEYGDVDKTIVLYHDAKGVLLKNETPGVFYQLECPHTGVSKPINCTERDHHRIIVAERCVYEEAKGPIVLLCTLGIIVIIFFSICIICCICKRPKGGRRMLQEISIQ